MIPATTDRSLEMVCQLEAEVLGQEQVQLATDHVLHAGVYARTVTIPAGVVVTGSLMKIATVLIIEGEVSVFMGDDTLIFRGYNVVPALAGRKTAVLAHTVTHVTMLFHTDAETVAAAEAEFTDETDKLKSRKEDGINTFLVTGSTQ